MFVDIIFYGCLKLKMYHLLLTQKALNYLKSIKGQTIILLEIKISLNICCNELVI